MNIEYEKIYSLVCEYKDICKVFGNILDSPSRGGNISIKDEEYLLIKASGQDLNKKHKISILKNGQNIGSFDGKISNEIIKPSMEIGMHQIFKNKYVAHYHPVYLLPYLCDKNFLFSYNVIDFQLPGKQLCEEIKSRYVYQRAGVVMLRNHGVIIFSEEIEDLFKYHRQLREEFMEENINIFTPDDAIDSNSDELWLFRETIENIARKKGLRLSAIDNKIIEKLVNMPDEQYRSKQMKNK